MAPSRDTPIQKAPLSDAIIMAIARLVDDAQTQTREPSHSDLEFQITRSRLTQGDPKTHGQTVGKAKRIRATLNWAYENNLQAGEQFICGLINTVRGCGGFRISSPNFVGENAIQDAQTAFKSEGFLLTSDGELRPILLDNLTGVELTEALQSYVRRAKRGADDAALVTGTGKDLLEATAALVVQSKWGSYSSHDNFPTLLGQAFTALNLATSQTSHQAGEHIRKRLERAMYETGCAVNALRNKQGTGHGRPWLPDISDDEARIAIELMGSIAEKLLIELERNS